MALADFVIKHRAEILEIAQKHGVTSVKVFGSSATGAAGPGSDLDLLVQAGDKVSPWFPGGLVTDLEKLLGRKVDVAEPESLHWYIRDRVLKEAVPL